LDRAELFLNPNLQGLVLEIGTKFPQLNHFLTDLASRTHLSSFTFVSPTALPDAFTELLRPQSHLQRVALVAPGALSPGIGRWVASLPLLRTLRLDLSGRSDIAVEGFFDDIRPSPSGSSTPTSAESIDSGVFSGEEMDFSEIRKSSLRLTGDLRSTGGFSQLRQLHLTGEVSNIAVFLKHLTANLTQLELVIEDPPGKTDWQDLSTIISDKFSHCVQTLRISATGSSRFVDLVRSTSRAEPPSNHLSLERLTDLTSLVRLEIDLPQSIVFYASDIAYLASACPNVEVLRLCPLARFPVALGPPKLVLADLAPLVRGCRRLHTLAVVINATGGRKEVLASRKNSSRSLLRVHVGHSWVDSPLQTAILLSHFAPHLESLKWFHEKGRSGVVEANAERWQTVLDFLPHLQNMRLVERSSQKVEVPLLKLDKSIDATISTMDCGISAMPSIREAVVQCSPSFMSRAVEAIPQLSSASVDARPSVVDANVHATPFVADQGVDACRLTLSTGVDTTVLSASADTTTQSSDDEKMTGRAHVPLSYLMLPSVLGLLAFCKILFSYPLSIPFRIINFSASTSDSKVDETLQDTISEKGDVCDLAPDVSPVGP